MSNKKQITTLDKLLALEEVMTYADSDSDIGKCLIELYLDLIALREAEVADINNIDN